MTEADSSLDSDWLENALGKLARGEPSTLEGLLTSFGEVISVPGTKAYCRTHFVVKDTSGIPRIDALARYLAFQVVDYCIPRKILHQAELADQRTGSHRNIARLADDARNLFAKMKYSGENGEILLFTLLETVLKIPQILCKMSLKTNSNVHIHGSDGIHAKYEHGVLALYWGESKLHASVNSAIDECFESLAPFLTEKDRATARQDLFLIRNNLDAGSEDVTAALIRYFDEDDAMSAKLEFRAACLIGFDLDKYPDAPSDEAKEMSEEIARSIEVWTDRMKAQIEFCGVQSFEIEIFCLPFPSVAEFRAAFLKLVVPN